jgi:hypothetical protein
MTAKIAIGVGVAVAGTAATAVMLFMPFPCLGGRSIKNIIQNHVQSWGGHASANSGAKNATDIDATAMSDPALGDTAEVTGPGANARSGNANARGGNANARGGDANTGPSPE